MNKIMIVEDEPTTRTLLSTLLGFEGYQILQTNELTEEGIYNNIISLNPDLVLMDVHLRQGNGLNLLQKIRKGSSCNNLFVVITSGEDYSYECRKFGADGFLMKPYMPDDLIILLKRILNSPREGND